MAKYVRKPDGLERDPDSGRVWEHKGYAKRIYWTGQMLSDLRNFYATTKNEELAGMLGVSPRTVVRKARELGLEKDPDWLHGVWDEHRMMAHASSRAKGYPGGFRKGEHAYPEGEFKAGHEVSDEQRKRISEWMRRWYRHNPGKVRLKSLSMRKAWERRRGLSEQ